MDGTAGPAFRFEGVTHRYGSHPALSEVDLEVGRGETVALLGANGAGKSTAIAIVLGLIRPTLGRVTVLGTSARRALGEGRIGVMLQTGSGIGLPPGVRVDQTLRMIRKLYRNPASTAVTVERAGIARLLGRQTHRLSGGQVQRVRFALAIAGNPELLFLDEPTSAMDVDSRRSFWDMIRELGREGRTTVVATHHLEEADRVADRVVVIDHGRVVADGSGAILKASVAAKRIRFGCRSPDARMLDSLEGVTEVGIHGGEVDLYSLDADATVRALVGKGVAFTNLEVTGAGLEEAFVALTASRTSSDEAGE
ncbi:MAG TPA: ABC transporter ATP-binding protein [Acidimicrobiales bacterium]|nr:ABC transporter ATP-binding protein [Acidimicrobiales bacterium]